MTLETHYKIVFSLCYHHKFGTIEDIEALMPFERDIYCEMVKEEVKRQEEEMKRRNG